MTIILASSSTFRKQILEKIGLNFICISPDIDETREPNEKPQDLVGRLAISKAKKIGLTSPNSLIIASDQVASIDNTILGKPHDHKDAVSQLQMCSGRKVVFYTSLCLLNTETNKTQQCVETFSVYFRKLTLNEINGYLYKETPYNCAGSFKSEALGITLFEKLEGDDPNTLVGLPLIKLCQMLQSENINPLTM